MTALRFEDAGGHRPAAESTLQRAGNRARRTLARLRQWRRRSRDRAELAALDNRMLADIGLSRAEAEFLSAKPFWRE